MAEQAGLCPECGLGHGPFVACFELEDHAAVRRRAVELFYLDARAMGTPFVDIADAEEHFRCCGRECQRHWIDEAARELLAE